ncbi:MAG: hypothetical protein JNJ60_24510 [Rhodocyclaceae bacterium]|nr:hypothetical protein [Rhodocyclaceae bacterium]
MARTLHGLPAWFFGIGVLVWSAATLADDSCRVIDPELVGTYSGGCKDGLAEGQGHARGLAEYKGGFKAGMKHGRGEKRWANGDRYIGSFLDDKRDGEGEYLWGRGPWKGQRYQGHYHDDARDGYGIYEWPTGDRYAGPWERNRMTGPPTPMMRLQAQARDAALKSYAVPGRRVCQSVTIGVGGIDRISASILAQSERKIRLRIEDRGQFGVLPEIGPVQQNDEFEADVLAWKPC